MQRRLAHPGHRPVQLHLHPGRRPARRRHLHRRGRQLHPGWNLVVEPRLRLRRLGLVQRAPQLHGHLVRPDEQHPEHRDHLVGHLRRRGWENNGGTVTGQTGDGAPLGTVTITATAPDSSTITLCSDVSLTPGTDQSSYTCTLGAAQLDAGTYTDVVASYTPAGTSSSNPDFAYGTSDSSSAPLSFTVTSSGQTSSTQSTETTSSVTSGAEGGETH